MLLYVGIPHSEDSIHGLLVYWQLSCKKKRTEGDIVLKVVVSETGKPVSCVVINSSDFENLDMTA